MAIDSNGWFTPVKKRPRIHFAYVSGDKISADNSGPTDFKIMFQEIVEAKELIKYIPTSIKCH